MPTKDKLLTLFSRAPSQNNKSDWDNIFLIDKTPPEWFPLRTRKIWGCAHYSLKAVIEWKKWANRPIEKYAADWRSRKTYLMTPRGIAKVLKKYKLKYDIINAKYQDDNEK